MKNAVIQFNENHKWCGCLGIIEEVTVCDDGDEKYLIGVPVPQQGTAYIFVFKSEEAIEYIGTAVMISEE